VNELSILMKENRMPFPVGTPPERSVPARGPFSTQLQKLGEKVPQGGSRPVKENPVSPEEKPPEVQKQAEEETGDQPPLVLAGTGVVQPQPEVVQPQPGVVQLQPELVQPEQAGSEPGSGLASFQADGARPGEPALLVEARFLLESLPEGGGLEESLAAGQPVPAVEGDLEPAGEKAAGEVLKWLQDPPGAGLSEPGGPAPEFPDSNLGESFSSEQGETRAGVSPGQGAESGLASESGDGQLRQVFSASLSEVAALRGGGTAPARPGDGLNHLVPGSLIDPVSQAVVTMSRGKISSLNLELNPPELGKIDLQVSAEKGGTRIALVVDTLATGALLESHLSQLRKSLTDMGVNLLGLSIGFGGGNQKSDGEKGEFNPFRRGRAASIQVAAAQQVQQEPVYSVGGSGLAARVDCRI
jgi:hypothetical protein